jgi:hypothetical protein
VNKHTVAQRGWKVENASHAIDVQVADGRVLALDKVAAVELQLPPGLFTEPTHTVCQYEEHSMLS